MHRNVMSNHRTALLALAATALAAVPARGQQARTVTLNEALTLAARAAPAMVQAQQDVRVAQAQERRAFGAFLPTISSSANESYTPVRIDATTGGRANAGASTPYNQSVSLSANLDLFTGFRRGADRRAAAATTELREAAQIRQEYAVALATKQAYFNALATQELVAVAETRLRSSQEQLNLARERLRQGAATRSDSLQARVQFGTAQLALITAQNDLRNAQAALARQIGVEGLVAATPDTALEVRTQVLDTAVLRREAFENAPSTREAQASLAAAGASLGASRAQYMPTISASLNQRWSRALNGTFSPTPIPITVDQDNDPTTPDSVVGYNSMPFNGSRTFSISMSFPIFNGFQREVNVATADANVRTAEARLRDARLQLDQQLTQSFAALEAAAARVDIARVSVAAAEEGLRMQNERYRLGAATIVEVLTSQVARDQAQVDLVRTRYDYLVARAQIEAYVGHGL